MGGFQAKVVETTACFFGEFVGICIHSWFTRLNLAVERVSFAVSAPIDALEDAKRENN